MTDQDAKASSLHFTTSVLDWYDRFGRRNLPWHGQRDPYRIWVSEIMLQQTQVETVIPYYRKFIRRFPDIAALAGADADEVMVNWSGLGYYARARNLHRAARRVCERHDGRFPQTLEEVLDLPGIGRSTAGAILAFSRDARHPILDGNVKRILCRYHAVEGPPGNRATEKRLWALADGHTPSDRVAEYTQAIMDLGSKICRPRNPLCRDCPVRAGCRAHARDEVGNYPARKPPKARPVKSCRMLLLRRTDGCFLLCKRPPKGIWGGLWSLPQLDDPHIDATRYCLEALGIDIGSGRELEQVRHGFSHYDLVITPVLCRIVTPQCPPSDRRERLWYDPQGGQEAGLPAAVERIFSLLDSQS
ncbi:MAG: A/G-specific adenine glycosylase [Gammaproteobacteria bacterium]|nr:A/G-specific adenine glycosylase [Gammaproteobacteria bacterium]MYJ51141.1 A/G-specific adenine glycosylase [Gammaproteobacteria bacterium]